MYKTKENDVFFPKVTIVIPVYNGANYMREAIDSALSQDYKNIEVLVVNDGSNDNGLTESIALTYGDLISYYKKENGGVASALNLGIEKMQGEYFSWLSHDDLYTKEKISEEVACLAQLRDKTTIVNCDYQVIDAQGNHLYNNNILDKYTKEQLEIPLFALFMGGIHGCSLLIHKSHFERVGLFDINLPTTQDFDLWYRMLRHQKIVYIDGYFVKSRSHENQDSKKLIDKHIDECSDLWIDMISNLTEMEMEEIWGNKLKFLTKVRDFLKYERGYKKVLEYMEIQLLEELKKQARIGGLETYEKIATETEINIGLIRKMIESDKKEKTTRVTFILGDAGALGGLNRVVLSIAGELSRMYDIYLLCNEVSDLEKGYEINPAINIIKIPEQYINADKLSKILYFISTDVYVESYNCSSEFLKLLVETKKLGIKSIAWNHEFYFIPFHDYNLLDCIKDRNEYLREADAVVWLNGFSASLYNVYNDNGVVIPNPLTIKSAGNMTTGNNKNILAMGRLNDPRKGLKELLEVFAKVLEQEPDANLIIVGDTNLRLQIPGEDSTYLNLINKLKIDGERIQCIPWTTNVEQYIINARVHVMPSIREGFGLVLTECAEYGVPSIVFSGSGLDDIIEDGKTGVICPQNNIDFMAIEVLKLIQDDIYWKALSKAAKERNKIYYMENISKKWVALIDAIVDGGQGDINAFLAEMLTPFLRYENEFYNNCMMEYESALSFLAKNIYISVIKEPVDNGYYDSYQQIINSTSWKLTKPLRCFFDIIKQKRCK